MGTILQTVYDSVVDWIAVQRAVFVAGVQLVVLALPAGQEEPPGGVVVLEWFALEGRFVLYDAWPLDLCRPWLVSHDILMAPKCPQERDLPLLLKPPSNVGF